MDFSFPILSSLLEPVYWPTIYYLSEWTIRIVMLLVLMTRRRQRSPMAWLMIIFFLPWVGLILYWIVGDNRLPNRRVKRHQQLRAQLADMRHVFDAYRIDPRQTDQFSQQIAFALAERLTHLPIVRGNQLDLFDKSEPLLEQLVDDIDRAERHVHLLFYIFEDDPDGYAVGEALRRAVGRGVSCRLLVDAVGSRPLLQGYGQSLIEHGVELHEALPVGLFRRRMARVDLRNHRKLVVIDGRIAYTGSHNVTSPVSAPWGLPWADVMARITGPVVLQLQSVFVSDWYCEVEELLDSDDIFPPPEETGSGHVQTLPSGPDYPLENFHRLVVSAIHAARERIVLVTPYFVPNEPLMHALLTAPLRGVQVQVIVPEKSDHRVVLAASHAYYDELLAGGVEIYHYDLANLHAKTLTIDNDIALCGSGNMDIRSFELNFELTLIFYGTKLCQNLRRLQERLLEDAEKVDLEEWRERPLHHQIAQNTARLVSPLL